jgi:hypothetical protein
VAQYRGNVTKLPTVLHVRCLCGHSARVQWSPGRARPALRCRRCGTLGRGLTMW